MHIRFAKQGDVTEIAALHASSWNVTYSTVLTSEYLQHTVPAERQAVWQARFANPKENQLVLVAEEGNKVVGFACAFVGEHVEWGSYLENLHVARFHQGKSIGTALLVEVASICAQRCPGQGLYLSVNQANQLAQNFYLALGAYNAQASIWDAPDGSKVPTFRFWWKSVVPILERRLTRLSTQMRNGASQ